jgi:hypothetical protein
MRRRSRFLLPGLLPGLVLALTTACTASWAFGGSRATGGGGNASSSTSGTGWTSSTASASGSRTVSLVSCSGSACSVTLGGRGSTAEVFGTLIVFDEISGGRAGVHVGGTRVTVTEGERVSAGRLELRCTRVTEDTVSFSGAVR